MPAPTLDLLRGADHLAAPGPRTNRSEILTAALGAALRLAGTPHGHLHLVEGGLRRLAAHAELAPAYVRFATFTAGRGTPWDHAVHEGRRLTVADTATDVRISLPARAALARTGSRACVCLPMTDGDGRVLAVVTAHYPRPLRLSVTALPVGDLGALGAQVGTWLAWHRRTVVLDALEHLHRTATGRN